MTPIYKKGCRDDPGNYRPVSLTSVPGMVMEQIVLREMMRHVRDNWGIRPSQHGFAKGRSCLTNLISFYDLVTCLVDEGKAADVVYLDFSKAFDSLPQYSPAEAGSPWLGQIHSWLGSRLNPHNSGGNSQRPATPTGLPQVHGIG